MRRVYDVSEPAGAPRRHRVRGLCCDDVPVNEVLRQALAPILRDLRRAGLDEPRITDSDWTEDADYPSAMMWSLDGSGAGVSVSRSAVVFERIAEVADQVQEWAIEE